MLRNLVTHYSPVLSHATIRIQMGKAWLTMSGRGGLDTGYGSYSKRQYMEKSDTRNPKQLKQFWQSVADQFHRANP